VALPSRRCSDLPKFTKRINALQRQSAKGFKRSIALQRRSAKGFKRRLVIRADFPGKFCGQILRVNIQGMEGVVLTGRL